MGKITLKPTENQNFILLGGNFQATLDQAHNLESEGDFEGACRTRYYAFQNIVEVLPEDEGVELDFSHPNTRSAIELIYASSVDNFLTGDAELAAAQLELLLECDPEDHFESVNLLALCYIATEEWEAFDDLVIDLTDKSAEAVIARLWASFERDGGLDRELLKLLRTRHKHYYEELIADEHPDDEVFRHDIASDRPTPSAEAREWWLLTEPLWGEFPEFVYKLKSEK